MKVDEVFASELKKWIKFVYEIKKRRQHKKDPGTFETSII